MPMICYWAGELGEGERNQNQEHDTKKENLRRRERGRGDPGTAAAPPGAEEDQPAQGHRGWRQDVPLQPRRCQHREASFPPCPVPNHSLPAPSRVSRSRSAPGLQLRIHLWAKGSGGWTGQIRQPGCSGGGTGVGQRQPRLVDGRAGPLGTGDGADVTLWDVEVAQL